MAINLAEKYSKKVADKFYLDSVILGKTSREYEFDGVKSVNVWTITTQAPGNYTRSGASRYGTPSDVQDTKQTLTVTQDKSVSMVVDKGDNTQQMMIKNAGKVVAAEMREQFIPMFDKYVLQQTAENAGVGHAITSEFTKSTIVDGIAAHVTDLMNARTNVSDCYCFIRATDYAALCASPEFLNIDKLGEKALDKGVVGKVRGLSIVPVPDDYMPTALAATAPAAVQGKNARLITFKKNAVVAPTQIKDIKIHQDAPGISGALMEIRWLFDSFVLDAKDTAVIVTAK